MPATAFHNMHDGPDLRGPQAILNQMNRRNMISLALPAASAFAWVQDKNKPIRPEPDRGQRQDLDLVKAFVQAGHLDANLPKVEEYLEHNPKLVYASWDWGGGDWETALGGASHIGSRQMARYLLDQGARIDSFCAAMLGQHKTVAALVEADPAVLTAKGPHGYSLLYHVAISGEVTIAELLKPHLPTNSGMFSQALSAAVRDGHLAMTRWLFENGEVNPNLEDALGHQPLYTARQKGFADVASELLRRGARETDR